ncbi:hypothetical protein HK099_002043, partial [Clydaea vesicula]
MNWLKNSESKENFSRGRSGMDSVGISDSDHWKKEKNQLVQKINLLESSNNALKRKEDEFKKELQDAKLKCNRKEEEARQLE